MEIVGWLENSGVLQSWKAGGASIFSVGHIFALLAFIGLWKYPRPAFAFDPNPRSSGSKTTNPMFTPPPPESSSPPPRRALSDWETESSASFDSQSVDGSTSSEVLSPPPPQQVQQQQLDPSPFLRTHAPGSTPSERQRFLVARDGNEEKALENLVKYMSWRKQFEFIQQEQEQKHHNLQYDDPDLFDWIVASQTALHANQEAKQGWQWLPRIVRTHPLPNGRTAVDRDGQRVLHMIPAQIDDQICSLSTYSLAIALYLDRTLRRKSLEKITILMDLRPGEGWRNISAVRLLPFIKSIVGLLLTMFPERLHKCILYPLPFALTWVFGAVKKVIDPVTAGKLAVLSGSAGIASPLPLDQLVQHMDRDVALICENERLASFTS